MAEILKWGPEGQHVLADFLQLKELAKVEIVHGSGLTPSVEFSPFTARAIIRLVETREAQRDYALRQLQAFVEGDIIRTTGGRFYVPTAPTPGDRHFDTLDEAWGALP